MGIYIDDIIYAYILVCIGLILFNVIYMFFTSYKNGQDNNYIIRWDKYIKKQIELIKDGKSIEPEHKNNLEKRLMFTNQLVAYVRALDKLREQGFNTRPYLFENYESFQYLAGKYKNEEVVARAFFAYFISKNAPCDGIKHNSLIESLLSYLNNSNMYCRENVLKALYSIGNLQSVENAFHILDKNKYFHHYKLLSDGLLTFTGDKEALAEKLYRHIRTWDVNMAIAVIKFISLTSDKYNERFLLLLKKRDVDPEIRIAIIRYFGHNVYEPAYQLLLKYMKITNFTNENIVIVTASVLDKYPGNETITVLKEALKNPNWYIRYNSAISLVKLKVGINELQDILNGEDQYAKEIITYIQGLERNVDKI